MPEDLPSCSLHFCCFLGTKLASYMLLCCVFLDRFYGLKIIQAFADQASCLLAFAYLVWGEGIVSEGSPCAECMCKDG